MKEECRGFTNIEVEKQFIIFRHKERGDAKFDFNTGDFFQKKVSQKKWEKSFSSCCVYYFRKYYRADMLSILSHFLEEDEKGKRILMLIRNIWTSINNEKYSYNNGWSTSYRNRNVQNISNVLWELHNQYEEVVKWSDYGLDVAKGCPLEPNDIPKDIRKFMSSVDFDLLSNEYNRIIKNDLEIFLQTMRTARDMNLFLLYPSAKGHLKNSRNMERIIKLIKYYNYTIERLFNYVFGYLEPYEYLYTYESLNFLDDYAEMCTQMSLRSFEKYPRYLKSKHDIVQGAWRDYKITYSETLFQRNLHIEYEFKSKEFSVVMPKSSEELKIEGQELNHCVGSYIKRVSEGETEIYFLRKTKKIDVPLVTIEIRKNI